MAEDHHDHIEQDLMPSALKLRLMPGPSASDWQVTRFDPNTGQSSRIIPTPWERDHSFFQALHRFWQLSRQMLAEASAIEMLDTHAAAVGDQLANVLTAQDHADLATPAADGITPCLVIESADETILSLPWELLRLQNRFAVREGLLDVVRSVLIDAPPTPLQPVGPLTLLMTVAAPEPSTLRDEDEERYRLLRAVPAPITPMLNETGELEEFVTSVRAAPVTFGIHFSGHADDGQFLFEDTSGQGRMLQVENLQHAMQTTAPEQRPSFFFLALDHDAITPFGGEPRDDRPWLGRFSTASKLHQAGIPQVVAYDRTVRDHASPVVESAVLKAFYTAMAHGHSTRDAVRAARRILTTPSDASPHPASEVGIGHKTVNGVQPYAWTHLSYYHRGAEYPLSEDTDLTASNAQEPADIRQPLLGRRKALHGLRRMRQAKQDIVIVQGFAGVGKSAFCYEALQLYKRLGYTALTLRCGDVEFDSQPLNTLLWQCTKTAAQLTGTQWPTLCAILDESVANQPNLPSPATRLLMLLQVLLQRPGHTPLVLYLDNLESLMSRPSKGSFGGSKKWSHAEMAELWHALVQSVREADGQLLLLASCRVAHPDLQPYQFSLKPLASGPTWHLLDRLPVLQHLAPDNRHRLVKRIDGHPQLAILLDALLYPEVTPREPVNPPSSPTPHTVREEWRQRIAPVLPTQNQPLSEPLLFKAIWNRRLDEPARCLLVRATVLRAPADLALMQALALETDDAEAAHHLLDDLSACALLETIQPDSNDGKTGCYFAVKPSIARLAQQQTTSADTLLKQGHLLAGEVFEDRAWHANDPHAAFEAAYHLGRVDEADRSFELLLGTVQWLHSCHRLLDSLTVLESFLWPETLSLHNQARLLMAQGQTYAGLDHTSEALNHLRQAVDLYAELTKQDLPEAQRQHNVLDRRERVGDVLAALGKGAEALATYQARLTIAERLAARDPQNPQWQRELSANHVRIGDVLAALGEGDGTLASYQVRLAVAERMAASDPTNLQWQQELASSYSRVGDILAAQGQQARAMAAYQAGRAIYARLVEAAPTHPQWQQHLALSQEKIGSMFAAQGHPDEALAAYRVGLSQRTWLTERAPDDPSLQRDLALSQEKIGDLLAAQKRDTEALTAYHSGLVIRAQLVQRDANEPHWQQELAATHGKLADLLMTQGQPVEALSAYRAELAIRAGLVAQEPDNMHWLRDLSVSHNKIGDILAAQACEIDALAAYRDSLAIRLQLVNQDPENLQWLRDLSVSQEKVGDILALQGQTEDALAAYRTSLSFRAHLASQDPTHVQWQRDLSVCHNKIGDRLEALGDRAGALASYRDDLAIAEHLAALEPFDTRRQTDLVVTYWKLARIHASLRPDSIEPAALLGLGLTILRRLQSESRLPPSQSHWLVAFEQALHTRGPSRHSGKFPKAARAVWRVLRPWKAS